MDSFALVCILDHVSVEGVEWSSHDIDISPKQLGFSNNYVSI